MKMNHDAYTSMRGMKSHPYITQGCTLALSVCIEMNYQLLQAVAADSRSVHLVIIRTSFDLKYDVIIDCTSKYVGGPLNKRERAKQRLAQKMNRYTKQRVSPTH